MVVREFQEQCVFFSHFIVLEIWFQFGSQGFGSSVVTTLLLERERIILDSTVKYTTEFYLVVSVCHRYNTTRNRKEIVCQYSIMFINECAKREPCANGCVSSFVFSLR